jgi:hypothetical protein
MAIFDRDLVAFPWLIFDVPEKGSCEERASVKAGRSPACISLRKDYSPGIVYNKDSAGRRRILFLSWGNLYVVYNAGKASIPGFYE